MGEKASIVGLYKPSPIHAIYRWVDQLPGPYWLFSVAFLVFTGLLDLVVAWKADVLPFGEINWYYALTGAFAAYFVFANDFLLRVAKRAVAEFLSILEVDENRRQEILFEFTHLPARTSGAYFILGAIMGFLLGIYRFQTAPEMNPAFPALEVPIYSLSQGMGLLTIYQILRASRLISRLFEEKMNIDLFDQTSLYAISRYAAWLVIVTAIFTYLVFVLIPSFVEITVAFLTLSWLIVLIMFWLPLQGANRILVSKKRRLLNDVNLRIKTNFDLLHSKMDNHEYKNIADIHSMLESLQIEREDINTVRTWPWPPRTLTVLLTTLVLPILVALLTAIFEKFVSH